MGRAERYALLQVARILGSSAEFVFTDLLALETECQSWGEHLEAARAAHATLWRKLRGQEARPQVIWVPAHQDLDGYIQKGIHPALHAGNMWADWFATQGALMHTVSQVYEDFYKVELQHYQSLAKYVGWAMQRSLKAGRWDPAHPFVRNATEAVAKPVAVVAHRVVRLRQGGVTICRACGQQTSATAGAAWAQFLRSPCDASSFSAARAEAIIEHVGADEVVSSAAGEFAAQALTQAQCAEDPWPDPGCSTPWSKGDVTLEIDGHKLNRAGPTVYCEVCVAWADTGTSIALRKPCTGPPSADGRHQRTYLSNLKARLRKLSRGLHPKTGKALTWGSGLTELAHGLEPPSGGQACAGTAGSAAAASTGDTLPAPSTTATWATC